MKYTISKSAVCPFYLHESRQLICCEGVGEGNVIHVAFANATDAKNYKVRMCRHNYRKCAVHKMLEGKYEDEI